MVDILLSDVLSCLTYPLDNFTGRSWASYLEFGDDRLQLPGLSPGCSLAASSLGTASLGPEAKVLRWRGARGVSADTSLTSICSPQAPLLETQLGYFYMLQGKKMSGIQEMPVS